MTSKVWVVGDESSPKTNQWLAMTNNKDEAEKLLTTLEGASTLKEVDVRPPRNNRRRT